MSGGVSSFTMYCSVNHCMSSLTCYMSQVMRSYSLTHSVLIVSCSSHKGQPMGCSLSAHSPMPVTSLVSEAVGCFYGMGLLAPCPAPLFYWAWDWQDRARVPTQAKPSIHKTFRANTWSNWV